MFYRLYSFIRRISFVKYNELIYAVGSASFLAAFVSINIFIIQRFIENLFEINRSGIVKYYIYLILAANYIYFLYRRRYLKIEESFVNETRKHKIISSVLSVIYVLLTLGSIVLTAIYVNP